MNKKLLAAVCLAAAATLNTAWADDYTSGDGRYEEPNFDMNVTQEEAAAVKDDKDMTEAKDGEEKAAPLPITMTGEYASYDSVSGDFVAEGNVVITQGTETLKTVRAEGNMKTGDVWLKQGGTLVEPDSVMNGEWVYYNFNNKTGEIKQIHGKGNEDFFRAPHATIYPDKMVVDQGGETTRCPAVEHSPCLLIKADTFEIYPHDKMVAHNVKVYVKGKHVYSRDTWVNNLNDDGGTRIMPSIGYDGDDDKGAYIKLKLDYDIDENTNLHAELPYYNRGHFKPIFQAKHDQRNYYVTYQSGWEEEDDEWVNKKNEIGFYYKPHYFIDGIPVTYRLYAHRGLWENDETGRQSWHTEYGAYLTHDRIYLFDSKKTFLDLTIGKKWVNESYTDETRSTMMYYGTLGQKLGDKWNTWVGYYREKVTSDLYDLGQPDMERELRNGISYKPDDRNTFSIVNRYDTGKHENYETIYSWTHRFCCWAITFEYEHAQTEDEDTQWNIRYEFLNW